MNNTLKISNKVLKIFVIISIMMINIFSPLLVKADSISKGDIRNDSIKVGSLENQGDIEVVKTVEKTDKLGEYKITFNIKGNPTTTNIEKNVNSYTVFVLDASYSMSGNKWKKAKEAAINFSKVLVENSQDNYISLVTFNGNGYKKREFANKIFENSDFGNLDYYTNYNAGLTKALEYIHGIDDSDGIFNIVFISDGEPNGDEYSEVLTTLKNNNVNIYSLAYDLESNSKAYNILKDISTNDIVYEVSEDDISEQLTKVATEIIKQNAGSNATITDTIGTNFEYVSGNVNVFGNTVSYDIGDITENGTTFDFIVRINEDVDTGWYKTNEGFKLTYEDSKGNDQLLETNDSAEIYWVSNMFEYSINYYNESAGSEKIGTVFNKAKKGTVINEDNIDIDLYKQEGYVLKSINPSSLTISEDNTKNYIDVIYTKIKDLSYTVNYYYDGILDEDSTAIYNNIEYGSLATYQDLIKDGYSLCLVLNDNTYVIDNSTVVSVYYCKNDYQYQVKYYYEDELKDEYTYTNTSKYETVIDSYSDKIEEGYYLDHVENSPLTISDDIDKNIINVYYKLKNIDYTVNYLDTDNQKIAPSETKSGKYFDIITEEAISINGYNLASDKTVSIELNEKTNEINFYYEKIKGSVIVKYVDTEGNSISEDDIISGYFETPYSISVKDIDNYEFTEEYSYIEGVIDSQEKIITLVYEKIELENVSAPLTGISNNKYLSVLVVSLTGILTLIISKIILNLKK